MIKNIYLFFICIAFIYGIAIGRYEIFPFSTIQGIKKFLFPIEETATFSKEQKNEPQKSHELKVYWESRTSLFSLYNGKAEIVMFGDSYTDKAEWQEIFPCVKILNRGIIGDTTFGLLERIVDIQKINPKLIFIMIGLNDFSQGTPVDTVYENYVKILNQLDDDDTQIVVQATLNIREKSKKNRQVNELNRKLESYCEKNDIAFIDLNKRLAPSGRLNQEFSVMNSHSLKGAGYKIWANEIEQYILQVANCNEYTAFAE